MVTFDQTLFALAKQIQWKLPEDYGKDKIVVMFDSLHIKMAALKTLEDWVDGSGWLQKLVQPEMTTPGTADSFLRAAPVTTQGKLTKSLQLHSISGSTVHMTDTVREKLQRQLISSSLKTEATREEMTSLSSSTCQSCWN